MQIDTYINTNFYFYFINKIILKTFFIIIHFLSFRGDFVVEYSGELIEHTTAEERENRYAMDISKGCYMYYFKTNGKHYW